MHLKSSLLPLTLLLFLTLISASLPAHNHNHKRVLSRRAGAPINGTDPDSTWSINLGHQATSSEASGPTRTAGGETTTTDGAGQGGLGQSTQTQEVGSTSEVQQATSSGRSRTGIENDVDDDDEDENESGGTKFSASTSSSSSPNHAVTSSVVVVTTASSSTNNPLTSSITSSILSTSSTPTTTSTSTTPSSSSTTSSTLTTSTFTQPAQQISTVRSTQFLSRSSTPSLASVSATVSAGNSSANAASSEDDNGGGSHKLSVGKTAMIVIIVVASVIVGAIAIWTIIRKWKLAPSRKFDERMNPLDFSDNHMGDAFYEKTRRRQSNHSINSTASAQRHALAHDLDADAEKYGHRDAYDHGVPNHDFTAGPASSGYGQGNNYDPYGYPPQPHGQPDYGTYADEAVGGAGAGYANLRRGPSSAGTNFAGMGAGAAGLNQPQQDQGMPSQMAGHYDQEERLYDQSMAPGAGAGAGYGIPHGDEGLGRPTRGEGPYFAASQFGSGRGY